MLVLLGVGRISAIWMGGLGIQNAAKTKFHDPAVVQCPANPLTLSAELCNYLSSQDVTLM